MEHYRKLHRTLVFSHEELVCKIATVPDTLDLDLAKRLYENMKNIVDVEVSLRMALIEKVGCICIPFLLLMGIN